MRPALLALLLVAGNAAAQGAPFCLVDETGAHCVYDIGYECDRIARTKGGMCVVAPAVQPANTKAAQDILRRGRAAALSHKARAPRVHYACRTAAGKAVRTDTPAIGCVVVGID